MARVLVAAPDLMDQSKIRAAVAGSGDGHLVFAPIAAVDARVADDASIVLVVIDLSRPGALDAIAAVAAQRDDGRPLRLLAFGSHVDRPLLDAARDGGCDEVLARSAFFGRLTDVLG